MHGGDIYRNEVNIDFSVNINPLGTWAPVKEALLESLNEVSNYPDIECRLLREGIGNLFNLEGTNVVCGNGASELINGIVSWRKPKNALLLGPGFSGYKKALLEEGCYVKIYPLKEEDEFIPGDELIQEVMSTKPDIMFIANPSNPTGVLLTKDYLLRLFACKDTLFVIDECFIELTGLAKEHSINSYVNQFKNLIVLRAFTKSFAIPGVRLGYVLANEGICKGIYDRLPEWNVSVIAQRAGIVALNGKDYLNNSSIEIGRYREYLVNKLSGLGIKVYRSSANYVLFYCNDEYLYEKLLKAGILIRDCSDYDGLKKGFYRVSVKKYSETDKLISAIKTIMKD